MKLKCVLLFVFLLVFTIPSAVSAIPLTFTDVSPGQVVTTYHNQYGWMYVEAGIYNQLVGNEQVQYDSFCIEFNQWAPSETMDYYYEDLSVRFGQSTKDNIYKLWSANYKSEGMSAIDAAGLQIALWEVTGSDSEYNVYSGSFRIYGDDFGAQSMLNDLEDFTLTDNLSLISLRNSDRQDYLVSAPVPEPTTMLLLGTGLCSGAIYRRIKRKKR